MKISKKISFIASSAILGTVLFTGCGSDSSDNTPAVSSNGAVIKGYLGNARVWADFNHDGKRDDAELTDSVKGKFKFNQKPKKGDWVKIEVSSGLDTSDGKIFKGMLKGILKDNGTVNVTPVTTIITSMVEDSGGNISAAEKKSSWLIRFK
jgi:hypothetical protein